jgi:hypothetical protein
VCRVCKDYPDEAGFVKARQKEVNDLWQALKDKADERRDKLAAAEEEQQFLEAVKDFDKWAEDMKDKIKDGDMPRHAREADEMLAKHGELSADMKANKDRYDKMMALADKILARNPDAKAVRDKLAKMKENQEKVDNLWDERNDDLMAAKQLQIFLKEADQIQSRASNQEALMAASGRGHNLDDVAGLSKRQDDVLANLEAEEAKLKELNELADRLIREGHPDAKM